MNLLFALSWNNIWRSRKRSLVVIGSISVGVWALIFLFGFLNSFNVAYVRNAINYDYSHIQIHHPDYRLDPGISFFIPEQQKVEEAINNIEEVLGSSSRTIVNGIVATGKSSQGVMLYGVNPDQESNITQLDKLLLEGEYFTGKRNPILISRKVADKLGARIRSKIVITFQDATGEITSSAFRVDGIFDSKSPKINQGIVYVRQQELQSLVQQDLVHETALLLQDIEQIPGVKAAIIEQFPELEVLAFRELAPEFDLLQQHAVISKQILTGIIMLALLFGIINTMLMAVLERTKELGILRAVGMHKSKVFKMILAETVLLSLVGGPIGLFLGFLNNLWLGNTGIDFSSYAESLKQYGYDAVFYPTLEASQYPTLMAVVMLTALIGAIYPAIKAIKLNPVESIRKI